jgi:hypothetical protein
VVLGICVREDPERCCTARTARPILGGIQKRSRFKGDQKNHWLSNIPAAEICEMNLRHDS